MNNIPACVLMWFPFYKKNEKWISEVGLFARRYKHKHKISLALFWMYFFVYCMLLFSCFHVFIILDEGWANVFILELK